MIEVEKKFRLQSNFLKKIKREGTFISHKEFQDTYFDTATWRYTLKNVWLRLREDAFELKVAVQKERGLIDRYDEITDEVGILKAMDIPIELPLTSCFKKHAITPFCTFWTDRRKYQMGEFIIDIDTADFGDLTYSVAEVEILVPTEKEIAQAEDKIETFLVKQSVDWNRQILGKLSYYLSQRRPDHYNALVKAKVIKEG